MEQRRHTPHPAPGDAEALLAAAREALGTGEWSAAAASFEAVLQRAETAEALFGLGSALWWLGETEASVRYQARAFAAFRQSGDPAQAVLVAISLYFVHRISLGDSAVARGWLGRAARLVEELQLAPLAGWVLLLRAHDSDDPAAAERWARQARELAPHFGDTDLELCALSQLGASLVHLGRIEEGLALLDEAMAGSLAGEGQRLETVVYTGCNMISSCSQAAEIERAAQWTRAADEFTRRYGSLHLYTLCRTYYGSLLFSMGRWAEAEEELTAALRMGKAAERALYGQALAGLAELRLAQGRIDEAARLLAGFEDHVATAGVLGALHLARREPVVAAAILRRRLREIDEQDRRRVGPYRAGAAPGLESAILLERLVAAELQQGAVDQATANAQRLAELGARLRCELIAVRGARSLGRALVATGDRAAAIPHLERALAAFARLAMPCEAGRTHLLLAQALAAGERQTAIAEGQAALAAFEALGAERLADEAAAFLRALGVKAARTGPRGSGLLTKREREVLALLGEGLSNRELAERLFITRKTVEHHVASILAKLALSSRAEAAAYAVRHPD
ncbi:MAG TPA: response regulator transcription factor [Thermomicrobiales bacterium]|nr:response regulator transcription factor [Thermomicrobiales bacterium]